MTAVETQPAFSRPGPHVPVVASVAPIGVLVVDDHPAVRAGLHDLLCDQPDLDVVAAVETAEAAVSVAEREPVDVAVVDYHLGTRNGLWCSRKLKRLDRPPAVLVDSAFADGSLAAAAIVAQADGLADKSALGSQVCDSIRALARGERRLAPVPQRLADSLRVTLDVDQQAIFGMLAVAIEPGEIAATLGISAEGLEARLWDMMRRVEAIDGSSSRRDRGR